MIKCLSHVGCYLWEGTVADSNICAHRIMRQDCKIYSGGSDIRHYTLLKEEVILKCRGLKRLETCPTKVVCQENS